MMRYVHHRPVAESHEVSWDHRQHRGIYNDAPRQIFSSLRLSQELATWLDENAPGWTFRSDWDYSNAGDDDEGCHLTVPTAEVARAFIEKAEDISRAWTEADRARMRIRVHLESPTGRHELLRAHRPADMSYQMECGLRGKLPLDDHRYAIFADRDAMQAARELVEEGGTERRVALRLRDGERVHADAGQYTIVVTIVDMPQGDRE